MRVAHGHWFMVLIQLPRVNLPARMVLMLQHRETILWLMDIMQKLLEIIRLRLGVVLITLIRV